MLWIFIIFILLFLPAVLKAISKIKSDRKRHRKAEDNLHRFEKKEIDKNNRNE